MTIYQILLISVFLLCIGVVAFAAKGRVKHPVVVTGASIALFLIHPALCFLLALFIYARDAYFSGAKKEHV